jgi:glycosyltransferase involved in cell wall biosynthesis
MVMNYLRKIDRSKVIFDFVVHREERGAYEEEIESMGGRIFRFPPPRVLHTSSYKKFVSDFFDSHPEYEMIHGHCSELGYFVYREAHRRGFKFIATHAHNEPVGFNIKTPIRNVLKLAMRPYLTHYFTCSRGAARWLFGKQLAKKVIFFPNAIDACSLVFDPEKRKKVRYDNGWSQHLVVGNISRFSYQKNHLFLLDIFIEVVSKEPLAILVLIGTGGEMEKKVKDKVLQLGLKDNVKFMGSRSDIPDLLQAMDLFLFPSHFEGLSVAQLEAQASGLKIINSTSISKDGTIVPELIESLSLDLSAKKWAERVLSSINNYERKNRFQEISEAGFDINKNAEWLQNLYITESQR